jgi:hypothetical protein
VTDAGPGPDAASPTRRTRPPRTWLRVVLGLLVAIALVAVGIAIGVAFEERPVPGGTQTLVRTLEPLPQTAP